MFPGGWRTIGVGRLLQHALEPLLKLAAVPVARRGGVSAIRRLPGWALFCKSHSLSPGEQFAQVEGDEPLRAHRLGHVAVHDALG